ncbi:RNA polymerase II-binding domain-containing protein [Phthorimaea operculella]|nr:RNA polymerase II-binding domain-containing protein [Phthorimaea operculella]
MGEIEEFNPLTFEKRLTQLKDTQESIQGLSSWCLKQREHHKKIVQSWLNVLKRVKVEQRLVLFYLANDVIQYSKRKNYEFVESWGLNLQKATPLVRDEKVRHKILRIFKIWEQRAVYDEEFLSDLTGLLSAGAIKKTDDDPLDFQPQQLVNKIRQCTVLEADTDLRLKYIHESHLELSDADALCANLKDRSNKDDVEKELNEGIQCVERYTQALQREIVAREALLALLTQANQYYSTQRGEVKVVAYAYKNFGARVRALKRKLDELIPTLPSAAPSPPQRDEDVPSPGPDEDLDLPVEENDLGNDISYNIDRTFNTSITADGSLYNLGLSSFLSSENPMAFLNDTDDTVNTNKIEVINSRPNEKQDFDINSFLKTLVPNDSNTNNDDDNSGGAIIPPADPSLPGLDLLSDSNPPPPTSFYGTMNSITDDNEYHPELNTQWNSNAWSTIPPAPVPPPTMSIPPPAPVPVPIPNIPNPPISNIPVTNIPVTNIPDMPSADVDHRGLLPPPPPPPVLPLLGNMEDVDHRLLPTLPPPPPPATTNNRHSSQVYDLDIDIDLNACLSDVDHRNLISLTHQPAQPRGGADPRSSADPRSRSLDQDYRVPPLVPPNDVVEIVDMDLSEDEDQQGMYQNEHRRNSFNNNKVLVGGDNGKTNHKDSTNLQVNDRPHTAPVLPPMTNPFDNMPIGLKNLNMPFNKSFPQYNQEEYDRNEYNREEYNEQEENSNDSAYEDDLRSRGIEQRQEFENFEERRPFNNQRFPRNWGPRTFRPPFGGPQQRPWNGPRPPPRWMGPRQRFW